MIYDKNLTAFQNVKTNIIATNLAKGRWGNKFRKYFNRHKESIYGYYPAYSFKEGMKDCTNANGSTTERLDEAISFRDNLVSTGDGTFSVDTRNTSSRHKISTTYDISVDSVTFSDDSVAFDVDLRYWLEELIFEKNLFDFEANPIVGSSVVLEIDISVVIAYINETIVEFESYSIDNSRANDDLELINHLGMCDVLANNISKPHKIKRIYFRFYKKVSPPAIYKDHIFLGYDPDYEWWKEAQFDTIRKKVKNFKDYCTFVVGEDDGSTSGAYTDSYVYVDSRFLELPGIKIYYFVDAFLDVEVRAKKNFFKSLFGAILLVVGIYLSAVSANPAWMKIAMIAIAIGSYSGAMSSDVKMVLMVAMFAYGVYSTDFATMSTMEVFQWSIENIDLVLNIVAEYKYHEDTQKSMDDNYDEQDKQDRVVKFIYNDSYDSYKIYEELTSVDIDRVE